MRSAGFSHDYPFFFNDTATTEIYALSLPDALPISRPRPPCARRACSPPPLRGAWPRSKGSERSRPARPRGNAPPRSEEHTSELQSRQYLVCRLLLEKKKINRITIHPHPRPGRRRTV